MADLGRLFGLGTRSQTPTSMSSRKQPADESNMSKSADKLGSSDKPRHQKSTPALTRITNILNLGGHKDAHKEDRKKEASKKGPEEAVRKPDNRKEGVLNNYHGEQHKRTPRPKSPANSSAPTTTPQILFGDKANNIRLVGSGDTDEEVDKNVQTWHSPTLIQMAEEVQAELMSQHGLPTALPIRLNSHVSHLVEGLYKMERKAKRANLKLKETKKAHERDLDQFAAISEEWIEREKQYKAEILRLEKLLAHHSDQGMETVALARRHSVVHRSDTRRFTAEIHRLSATRASGVENSAKKQSRGEAATSQAPLKKVNNREKQKQVKPVPLIIDFDHDVRLSEYLMQLKPADNTRSKDIHAPRKRHRFGASPETPVEPEGDKEARRRSSKGQDFEFSPTGDKDGRDEIRQDIEVVREERAATEDDWKIAEGALPVRFRRVERRSTKQTPASGISELAREAKEAMHDLPDSPESGNSTVDVEVQHMQDLAEDNKSSTRPDYEAIMTEYQPNSRRSRRFSFTHGDDIAYSVSPRTRLATQTTHSAVTGSAGNTSPHVVDVATVRETRPGPETSRRSQLPSISARDAESSQDLILPSRASLVRAAKANPAKRDSVLARAAAGDGLVPAPQGRVPSGTVARLVARSNEVAQQPSASGADLDRDRSGDQKAEGKRVPATPRAARASGAEVTSPPTERKGASKASASTVTAPEDSARIAATRAVARMKSQSERG